LGGRRATRISNVFDFQSAGTQSAAAASERAEIALRRGALTIASQQQAAAAMVQAARAVAGNTPCN
jgi:hypothetical protein